MLLTSISIVVILIASILLILAVLVQSPKSGMAANFGAANQVMGVRESANILEKTSWWLAGIIAALSILISINSGDGGSVSSHSADIAATRQSEVLEEVMPDEAASMATDANTESGAEAVTTEPQN